MCGILDKLVIRVYGSPEEIEQQGQPRGEFRAMFNPENFKLGKVFQFDDAQADSETGSEQKFRSIAPREFNFELLLDGTGASGEDLDVESEIEHLRKITGIGNGAEKRPTYVTLSWGRFTLRCVLKKLEFKYSLFRADGTPVRATISTCFSEYKTALQQLAENPDLASSLTKLVLPEEGTPLDLLAHLNYGDSEMLVAIAQQNGLDSLRELVPGERLELPPLNQLAQNLQDQAIDLVEQASNTIQEGISNLF